ncbi:MAG: nucleotide sugar dehydrogenase, partial [Gammaproteobacteria bacterium]|nr:nucleotide sugar dehydrogenase [Gammaproteobacteria bacterium]
RIVGGVTPRCAEAAESLYRTFVRGEFSITTARMAELAKLTENAYRDVNIAFANEVASVCELLDTDPWELIELANRHPRVDVLKPGPGVGGHCIAVDPWFLVHSAPSATPLIQAARQVNDRRPRSVLERILSACQGLECPKIACLGLAYKADVGDMRESPAVEIVEGLRDVVPGRLLVVEPHVSSLPDRLVRKGIELVDLDDALDAAAVVVLLTDHREFRAVGGRIGEKRWVDTRGMWRGR